MPIGPLDPVTLGLRPHPEGGWYRETWRHESNLETSYGPRSFVTCVAFLLQPGERSAWHRVRSDELWLWQGGGPVRLSLGGSAETPRFAEIRQLGPGGQHLVPGGHWQAAEPVDGATLVACVVCPGFDFADFELAVVGEEPDGSRP